jgi:hypothetical protein
MHLVGRTTSPSDFVVTVLPLSRCVLFNLVDYDTDTCVYFVPLFYEFVLLMIYLNKVTGRRRSCGASSSSLKGGSSSDQKVDKTIIGLETRKLGKPKN